MVMFWGQRKNSGSDEPSVSSVTFGDGVTDGSWRIRVVGTNLVEERLEGGVWVEKVSATA